MRRMRKGSSLLRRKSRGVTDVPLELVIIMVILAIVIPIILAAFTSYTKEQESMALSQQAANIGDTAVQVYDSGINTTLLITASIPNNGYMTVGGALYVAGAPNPAASFINYSLPSTAPPVTYAVNNGAGSVNITNVTDVNGQLVYRSLPLTGGQSYQLALTKEGPGAYVFGIPVSSTFVWAEVV
jgi:type II secretory pathway pseudopilin PulG